MNVLFIASDIRKMFLWVAVLGSVHPLGGSVINITTVLFDATIGIG